MSSESLIFVIDGHSETGWPDPEFDFFLEWSMSLDFMETIFSTALDLTQDARLFSDTDVTIGVYEDIKQFFISRMSEKESCQECPDILLLDAVVRCALHLVGIEFNSILFILLMHKRNWSSGWQAKAQVWLDTAKFVGHAITHILNSAKNKVESVPDSPEKIDSQESLHPKSFHQTIFDGYYMTCAKILSKW